MKTLIFLVTFAVLASPAYFRALRSVLGGSVASPDGLARPAGLFIAGLVFIVALYLESRATSGFSSRFDFGKMFGQVGRTGGAGGRGMGGIKRIGRAGVAPGATAVGAAAVAEGPAGEGAPADEGGGADEGGAEEFWSY